MCGISGYSVAQDNRWSLRMRLDLVERLGRGIDSRGGHASGYVGIGPIYKSGIYTARCNGPWKGSSGKFRNRAALADTLMQHARYATHGEKTKDNAHPFPIMRDGKCVLLGAHNGVIQGTLASALKYQRTHTVDSRELFELLADGLHEDIRSLHGYGVIEWIEAARSTEVLLCRLSDCAQLAVARVERGGVVWGSTRHIVEEACKDVGLAIKEWVKTDDVGKTWSIHGGEIYETKDRAVIKVKDRWEGSEWYNRRSRYSYPSALVGPLGGWDDDETEVENDLSKPFRYGDNLDTSHTKEEIRPGVTVYRPRVKEGYISTPYPDSDPRWPEMTSEERRTAWLQWSDNDYKRRKAADADWWANYQEERKKREAEEESARQKRVQAWRERTAKAEQAKRERIERANTLPVDSPPFTPPKNVQAEREQVMQAEYDAARESGILKAN